MTDAAAQRYALAGELRAAIAAHAAAQQDGGNIRAAAERIERARIEIDREWQIDTLGRMTDADVLTMLVGEP